MVKNEALYVTVITPAALIIFLNCTALIFISCSLRNTFPKDSANQYTLRDRVRVLVAFVLLFGVTWVFGFLVVSNDIVALQYLFCIFSSSQGLFIFLFYCVRNGNVRKAVKEAFCSRRAGSLSDFNLKAKRKYTFETKTSHYVDSPATSDKVVEMETKKSATV